MQLDRFIHFIKATRTECWELVNRRFYLKNKIYVENNYRKIDYPSSVFIEAMNRKAKELLMDSSFFCSAAGDSLNNKSTVRDILNLAFEASKNTLISGIIGEKKKD